MSDLLNDRDMGCFDFDGKPISFLEWGELCRRPERRVALDHVGDLGISTVWIGVWVRDGVPLVYETMVFRDGMPVARRSYPTRSRALAGHAEVLAQFKAEVS